MAGEKLARLLHETAMSAANSAGKTDLIFGEVTSTSPITIKVDSRYTITEDFILLSSLCKAKSVKDAEDRTIVLWRGLKVGDKVRMLKVQNGQLFYVIEREGGVTL